MSKFCRNPDTSLVKIMEEEKKARDIPAFQEAWAWKPLTKLESNPLSIWPASTTELQVEILVQRKMQKMADIPT